MSVGEEIKLARIKKGWTQPELAKKSGLVLSTIYLLEKNGNCSVSTLYKVCQALKLNFKDLYERLKKEGE